MTIWFLIRAIDPPALNTFISNGKLLLVREPFSWEDERQLLLEYQIDTIVSKNSGGGATYAKIAAARELGLPVVMVQQPQIPDVEQAADVEGAIAWLIKQLLVISYILGAIGMCQVASTQVVAARLQGFLSPKRL
ncbi:precorrin-6A/cobalt-precorrin-6A reductase [Microcoleus sp. Pol10D4]|uniref:precorrin-6A/cobalt-precorrin-6A reductase n=1 Tax=Microcoleus sp. Pol10D4 TaxID=3055387 RepID=UPI002FD19D00